MLIGLHILFTISPVENEYNEAVKSAEIVKNNGTFTMAFVLTNYTYEDYPSMGSKYGADVYYETSSGVEAAWIAMEKPIGIKQPIAVMFNEDINNFALNGDSLVLPHEKPDEGLKKIAILLILLPLTYAVIELLLLLVARLFKDPFIKRPLAFKDPEAARNIAVRILKVNFAVALIGAFFVLQYFAASGRVEKVRAQESFIAGHLSEKCVDRKGSECDGRYKALYEVNGTNYARLFQVKGDILYDEDLKAMQLVSLDKTRVPLLYNKNDPRFSYALSSSEQVHGPYNPFILFGLGIVSSVSVVLLLAANRQRRLMPYVNNDDLTFENSFQ